MVPEKTILPVLDGLNAAIFIVDSNRRITFANRVGRKKFGAGLVGLDFVQIVRDPDCLKAIGKVIRGRKSLRLEIGIQGTVLITYRVTISRLGSKAPARDPEAGRAVISLEDISMVREAMTMRTDFVANVSHELRSPLTTISGFIETLKGAARDDIRARDRFLGIMEEQSQRMVRLIDDLLSLSKVQASEHLPPGERVDIVEILQRAVATLDSVASGENVAIGLDAPEDFSSLITGDGDQLLQVFLNLVENAIKYGGEGQRVDITLSDQARIPGIPDPAVAITITDRGPGIPREHIPRLTERFYRVDTGRSRQKGGTGLGLAIVKHIVARHRGRLQIRNNRDRGASFTVFLPR